MRLRWILATLAAAALAWTTVTGLPSTPSRNMMRQPQASRACVNPFNIWLPSYHGARASIASLHHRVNKHWRRGPTPAANSR